MDSKYLGGGEQSVTRDRGGRGLRSEHHVTAAPLESPAPAQCVPEEAAARAVAALGAARTEALGDPSLARLAQASAHGSERRPS